MLEVGSCGAKNVIESVSRKGEMKYGCPATCLVCTILLNAIKNACNNVEY